MTEINIMVKDREGTLHSTMAPTDMGMNLMEIMKAMELPVQAVCGGMAMCATCQCYILSDHPLPEMEMDEELMLEEAEHVKENSRLACQIPLTSELDGLKVELAPESLP